jgi:hypothetical protein
LRTGRTGHLCVNNPAEADIYKRPPYVSKRRLVPALPCLQITKTASQLARFSAAD